MMTASRRNSKSRIPNTAFAVAAFTGCGVPPSSESESESEATQPSSDDSSSGTEPSLPPQCEQAVLPTFPDNGCIEGEERVSMMSSQSLPEEGGDPGRSFSWSLSCVVEDVQTQSDCGDYLISLRCDEDVEYTVGIESVPGARIDIAQGQAVQYDLDSESVDDCCAWVAGRILDASGLVLAFALVNGDSTDADTEHAIELAFASLAGRRSDPTCDDGAGNLEYAVELTIDGQVVEVPHDTASDIGGYRVLVASARYLVGDADVGFLNEVGAAIVRTPPS